DLLPQRLRRSAFDAGDALIFTPVGPLAQGTEAVSVELRRGGKETSLGHFGIGTTGLAELPRAANRVSVLRVDQSAVLAKTVTLPLAAERELQQVLTFEMDRETPFKGEELYWIYRVVAADRQVGRLSVRLWLLPRSTLDPLLTKLAQDGIRPSRLEISDGPDRGLSLPLDGNGGRTQHASARLLWPAAACCATLALGA